MVADSRILTPQLLQQHQYSQRSSDEIDQNESLQSTSRVDSMNSSSNDSSNGSMVSRAQETQWSPFDSHYAAGPSSAVSPSHEHFAGYYSENGPNQHSNTSPYIYSNNNSSSNSNGRISDSRGDGSHVYLLPESNAIISNTKVPAPYDRYPSNLSGSRAVSTSHLAPASNNNTLSIISDVNSSDSVNSSHPLLSGDYSPFGGFPASSFPLSIEEEEPDDYLHNPDPIADALYEKNRFISDLKGFDKRSMSGLAGIIFFIIAAVMIFVVLPVLTYTGITDYDTQSVTYEVLTNYRYPTLSAIRTNLVDEDTPSDALTKTATDGTLWSLVFSDEFNAEGRTFYSGDDQFFTAMDFNYAATQDLEWYDPDAVTTTNGTLSLRMDAYKNHDLFYRSGMLQSWNQFCFTQGIVEFSARLPNYGNVTGLWPGLWTMGNLGRPGYRATTDGVWPYSYDSCDAGITANQSSPDGISYLPGQRLSACTCSGEDHPNRGVGRGAPEIDALEGEVDTTVKVGVASQSLQLAPMDIWYMPDYNFIAVHNNSITTMNTYAGGPFQEAVSGITTLNTSWYQYGDVEHHYQNYGFEYKNDNDDGYITWFVGNNPTFTVNAYALSPIGNIGWRRISKEPMSIIMNLGISNNWAYIDWPSMKFPVEMTIDYIRVYQPNDSISTSCDPSGYPTYDYIQNHLDAYDNFNLTSWEDAGFTNPSNNVTSNC